LLAERALSGDFVLAAIHVDGSRLGMIGRQELPVRARAGRIVQVA
jgi:hypothetical protein